MILPWIKYIGFQSEMQEVPGASLANFGFLMIVHNIAAFYDAMEMDALDILKDSYNLCRLMIDKRYQKTRL